MLFRSNTSRFVPTSFGPVLRPPVGPRGHIKFVHPTGIPGETGDPRLDSLAVAAGAGPEVRIGGGNFAG